MSLGVPEGVGSGPAGDEDEEQGFEGRSALPGGPRITRARGSARGAAVSPRPKPMVPPAESPLPRAARMGAPGRRAQVPPTEGAHARPRSRRGRDGRGRRGPGRGGAGGG